MYNSREGVLQFAAEVIPLQCVSHIFDGETLQTTEWESENGNERCAIIPFTAVLRVLSVTVDSNTSDKGLNDRIFDEELMKPLAGLMSHTTFKNKFREEAFATGEKE